MRIIIDGDATPSIDLIINLAKKYKIPVIIYADDSHLINKDAKTIIISKGYQAVDMQILKIIKNKDILITNDYGLASLALLKTKNIINSNGQIYNDQTIEFILDNRHQNTKNKNPKGPKKRKNIDDQNLLIGLKKIIELSKSI